MKDEKVLARQSGDCAVGKESNTCRGLEAEERIGHTRKNSKWFSGATVVEPGQERCVRMRL